jgi:hypothetical protein
MLWAVGCGLWAVGSGMKSPVGHSLVRIIYLLPGSLAKPYIYSLTEIVSCDPIWDLKCYFSKDNLE